MAKEPTKISRKGNEGSFVQLAKERTEETHEEEARVLLVPLIDTFVIIVVLLFQNFAGSGDIMKVALDLILPEGRVDDQPAESVIVAVTDKSIEVEGTEVATAEEALADTDKIIDGLYEELVRLADVKRQTAEYDPEEEFEGEVIIQGDRYITFEMVQRVMYTCGRAEYGEISLAVLKTATAPQTPVIEISLPPSGPSLHGSAPAGTSELNLLLIVTDQGFRIGGSGAILPLIPKKNGEYDLENLEESLTEVKTCYPGQESIMLISEPDVIYDDIVHIMDVCHRPGIGFADISLSGNIQLSRISGY
jgi:biopolymer transport protein ExbD